MSTINERIVFLIEDLGFSVLAFAKEIGYSSASMIQNVVIGRNKPGYETLYRILKTFPEIDAHWLLTGIGKVYKVDRDAVDIKKFRENYENIYCNYHILEPDTILKIKELELKNESLKIQLEKTEDHLEEAKKNLATLRKIIDG